MAQDLLSGDGSAFAFSKAASTGERDILAELPVRGLDEAIQLMRERPLLEAALKRATESASNDLTEESYAQQQRLRAEKEDFDRRLAALFQRDDII
jgi:DNA primase